MKFSFKEGILEVRQKDCVLRTPGGTLIESRRYSDLLPFVTCYQENHIVWNILCISIASFFLMIAVVITILTILREPFATFVALIPFLIGCFFFSKKRESFKIYQLKSFVDDSVLTLTINKKEKTELEFIRYLESLLKRNSSVLLYLKNNSCQYNPNWFFELHELKLQNIITQEEFMEEKSKHIPAI